MTPEPLTVLTIDDDQGDVELVRRYLEEIKEFQINFVWATQPEQSNRLLSDLEVDIILLDYVLGAVSGLEVLRSIRNAGILCPVIVLTGQGDEQAAAALMRSGADDYLVKSSLSTSTLRRAIEHARSRYHRRRLEALNERLLLELKEKNGTLEKANRRLSELYETAHEFVDNVSHEFRTPLTVVKEFSSILADELAGPVNEDQKEYLSIIGARADDLSLMVNDMLDISKLEAGLLGLSRKRCRLGRIVEHVRTTLERKASVNRVKLDFQLDDCRPEVYCDAEKIGRVIINLVVNAIKFSNENGTVLVTAKYHAAASEVSIGVTDSGSGIDADRLADIFDRFQQLDGGAKSSTKGFGLGLNIVRELVHLNLGDVSVKSEPGQGSTFAFTVPTAEPRGLIGRYLDRVKDLKGGSEHVSLVRLSTSQDSNTRVLDDLERLFQHRIRHCDLVFRLDQGQWLFVFASDASELRLSIQKIEQAREDANRNRPVGSLPAIHFNAEGTWRADDERQALIDHFCKVFESGELAHV